MTTSARLVLLVTLVAACEPTWFDSSVLGTLSECRSQVDCPGDLICHQSGFCLPSPEAPGDPDGQDGGLGDANGGPGSDGGPEPGADAGPPPSAAVQVPSSGIVGEAITLDGRRSDGTDIEYSWQVVAPDTEPVAVEDGNEPGTAVLYPLQHGLYRVTLVIEDTAGRQVSAPTVDIDVTGFVQISRESGANDVFAENNETLWVAADDGALRLEVASREWTRYDEAQPPGTTRVVTDPWFAWFVRTDGGALRVKKVAEPEERRVAVQQALPGIGDMGPVARAPNNTVWFGGSAGLKRTTASEFGSLAPRLEIDGDQHVRALLGTPDGVYVARASGVCLAPASEAPQLECEPRDVVADAGGQVVLDLATAMAVDGQGRLWVGTEAQGLYYEHDEGFATISPGGGQGLPAGNIVDLHADPGGDIWGTSTGGLFRVYLQPDGGHAIRTFGDPAGLSGAGALRGLHVTETTVWVATEEGLMFLLR